MALPVAAAAAIPAVIGGLGSLIGGASANRARRREAQKQRQFQERMRSTQWQAAVADMEAAGINPAVAYSKGPAAAPGGAQAQQEDIGSTSVSSALQSKRLSADLKLIQTQTQAASAQAQKTQSEKINQDMINRLWGTFTEKGQWKPGAPGPLWLKHEAEAASAAALARLQQLQIPSAKNLANIAGSKPGQELAWIKYLLNLARAGGGR